MVTAALQRSCTARIPALASGANSAKEFHRTAVRISQTRSWSSLVSARRLLMSSEYRHPVTGEEEVQVTLWLWFYFAGAAFGALAYILAPQDARSRSPSTI